jgi:multidrug efflux system membrane fusion protein
MPKRSTASPAARPGRHPAPPRRQAAGPARAAAATRMAALVASAVLAAGSWAGPAAAAQPQALASVPVEAAGPPASLAVDGVVQAVRQTAVAAQVSGAVVALSVKAGDTVRAGQVLLRLDARAADQNAAAGAAQVQAARAAQEAATREFERQKQLFQTGYISPAALEQAEARHKTAQAAAQAQLASAGAARTQTDFYVVKAPYAGVVADVAVVLGDMALPGRPLVTVYDPAALRVSAPLPQTVAARLAPGQALPVEVELPGLAGRVRPTRTQLLPTVDPATHTQELRLDLPAPLPAQARPGMFARAWLPEPAAAQTRLHVPARAVVRRAELTAVYVIGGDGRPLLRQVRLGRSDGERVEVLAGVAAGDRVALDPQAAARVQWVGVAP